MKRKAVLMAIVICAISFSYHCGRQDGFPVIPTLFVDGTFERAEGIAFNGEGELFVTSNRSFWHLECHETGRSAYESRCGRHRRT